MRKITAFVFLLLLPFTSAQASVGVSSATSSQQNDTQTHAFFDQALAARIDKYMMSGVEKGYAGTLLVAKGGQIILNKGYGLADSENNIANTSDTVFDIGSNTKQFTAAAIMKLVDQKKLSTTDRLNQFFEKVPEDKQDITVHHLLTHTSGLDNGFGGDFDGTTKNEFLEKAFASKLILERGKYRYSNAGYSLLAAIIEKVSGVTYETYLSENIFKPAGLSHTGYLLPNWQEQPLARQYWHGIIPRGTTIERYLKDGSVSWNLLGNGGIATTSNELFMWLEALKTDKILSTSTRDQLFAEHVAISTNPNRYNGYGWGVQTGHEDESLATHNGGNGTFYSSIAWYPKGDVTIIYASNTSTAEWPAYQVHRMIFEQDYVPRAFRVSSHRLVYEFAQSRSVADVARLPEYFEKQAGESIKHPALLNRVGIAFEEEGRYETAIALFKLNIELFPDRGNLWESLGEGYSAKGDKAQAISSYQKSLDIAPKEGCYWCTNARDQITAFTAEKKDILIDKILDAYGGEKLISMQSLVVRDRYKTISKDGGVQPGQASVSRLHSTLTVDFLNEKKAVRNWSVNAAGKRLGQIMFDGKNGWSINYLRGSYVLRPDLNGQNVGAGMMRLLDTVVARQLIEARNSAKIEGEVLFLSRRHYKLSFENTRGRRSLLFIDQNSNLISKLVQSKTTQYVYSEHRKTDGITYANDTNVFSNGSPTTVTLSRQIQVDVNVNDAFSIPAKAKKLEGMQDTSAMQINKLGTNTYVVGQGFSASMFVDAGTYYIGAGGVGGIKERYQALNEFLGIQKPLKYQVLPEHRVHLEGVNGIADLGATFVTVRSHLGGIKARLQTTLPDDRFLLVEKRQYLANGAVEVHDIQTLLSDQYLLFYVPESKTIFTVHEFGTQLLNSVPSADKNMISLKHEIERLGLDIENITYSDGPGVLSMDDLRRVTDSYQEGYCPVGFDICM
jgi:CubicO group peptidase (beta-lactamase class C family)